MVTLYQKYISGLLLDRIDIHLQVFLVEFQKLRDKRPAQILKYCALDEACQNLMKTTMRQLQLTARTYHRVLKLSRTIPDLAGAEAITQVHLAEAQQYRAKPDLM
jgi:magnesium chelatase family protein